MLAKESKRLVNTIQAKEFKALFKTKPHLHALAILMDWAIIFFTMFLTLQYPTIWMYLLAVLVIGARMHALAILMHDASHFRFLKNRTWNDRLTNLLIMYPIFSSIEVYRNNHLQHHQHLNTDEDPDWVAKLGNRAFTFPKTKREFLLTVGSYFFLYQGIMDAIWFLKRFGHSNKGKKASLDSKNKALKIGFYLILFSTITYFGLWIPYLLLWVVPYFSTFFMFQYIRSVAEHFGELNYENDFSASRTVVQVSPVERFFLAPHQVGYHLEHHLYPGVPFYNLSKLHQLLMQDADYRTTAHITKGYAVGLMEELGG